MVDLPNTTNGNITIRNPVKTHHVTPVDVNPQSTEAKGTTSTPAEVEFRLATSISSNKTDPTVTSVTPPSRRHPITGLLSNTRRFVDLCGSSNSVSTLAILRIAVSSFRRYLRSTFREREVLGEVDWEVMMGGEEKNNRRKWWPLRSEFLDVLSFICLDLLAFHVYDPLRLPYFLFISLAHPIHPYSIFIEDVVPDVKFSVLHFDRLRRGERSNTKICF